MDTICPNRKYVHHDLESLKDNYRTRLSPAQVHHYRHGIFMPREGSSKFGEFIILKFWHPK